MQQIEVGRWLFWSAAAVVLATFVLSILTPGLTSRFGPSYDFLPTFLIAALFLLLYASVAPRSTPTLGTDSRPGDSPAHPR
jgi:hypothetical protein